MVWMVSISPRIFSHPRFFSSPLQGHQLQLDTLIFHFFFRSLVRFKFLCFFLCYFSSVIHCNSKIVIIISFFASFSHWSFFYRSLSDSKSPQVSRTLLSILTDLNTAVVWTVSIRPSIFNSPNPLTKSLWRLFQVHQLQSVSPSLSCSIAFLVLS